MKVRAPSSLFSLRPRAPPELHTRLHTPSHSHINKAPPRRASCTHRPHSSLCKHTPNSQTRMQAAQGLVSQAFPAPEPRIATHTHLLSCSSLLCLAGFPDFPAVRPSSPPWEGRCDPARQVCHPDLSQAQRRPACACSAPARPRRSRERSWQRVLFLETTKLLLSLFTSPEEPARALDNYPFLPASNSRRQVFPSLPWRLFHAALPCGRAVSFTSYRQGKSPWPGDPADHRPQTGL